MRIINFAKRNFKEIIRDPLSIIFALLLPLFLLFIFQQIKIPNEIYNINNFTPGIVIFSLAFITMFTASLVAKDRSSSLLIRLGISPMKSSDYILGYIISLLPLVIMQNIAFYTLAFIYDLEFSFGIIVSLFITLLISILFISLGIIIGSITNEKSSSGVASIIVQLVAFSSGMYFDSSLISEGFNNFCKVLPFANSLDILKGVINNNYFLIFSKSIIVIIYTIIALGLAILIFKKKRIK